MRKATHWLFIFLFCSRWISFYAPDARMASLLKTQVTGISEYQKGYTAYQNEDYSTARQRFHQAAVLFQQEKNYRGQSAAFEGEARVALLQTDYEAAQSASREALEAAMFAGADWEQAQSYLTLGVIYWYREQTNEAISYLEISKDKLTLSVNQTGKELVEQWLAFTENQEGSPPDLPSPWPLQPAASDGSGVELPKPDVESMLGEANIYVLMGDFGKVANWCTQALAEVKAGRGSVEEKIRALDCMAEVSLHWGEYDQAFKYANDSLQESVASGDSCLQAMSLNVIGSSYRGIADMHQAEIYYQMALPLTDDPNCRIEKAKILNNMGEVELYDKKYPEASAYLEEALKVFNEAESSDIFSAMISLNLGTVYRHMGEYQKALDIQKDIFLQTPINVLNANIVLEMGKDELGLNNLVMASTWCVSAWQAFAEQSDLYGQAEAAQCVGRVDEAEGRLDSALDWYQKAIALREKLLASSKGEIIQQAVFSEDLDYYLPAIRVNVVKKDGPAAFALTEQARARNFLNILGNAELRPNRSENSPLTEQEFSLRQEMIKLQQQIRQEMIHPGPDPEAINQLQNELEATSLIYSNVLNSLQIDNSEYASLLSVKPFSVEDTQKLLRAKAPNLTILAYFYLGEQLAAFVISGSQFHTEIIPVSMLDLVDPMAKLEQQMKPRALIADAWKAPARQLYTQLIEPVRQYLPDTNPENPASLLIVPHLILHYLPFQLLLDGEQPLIEQYRISYAPSASSLQFLGRPPASTTARLLALANPHAEGYRSLRYAGVEAEAIAAIFQGQATVGNPATETLLKTQASEYRILHIAAHSDLNPQRPLFSAILLQKDEENDGRLQVIEIFDLDLSNTDLVVLSACETHQGSLSPGDELFGLERAFFRAGARGLLTSMWAVDDESTTALMKVFYEQLKNGASKTEAIRAAQLDMIQKGSHPYDWASFSFIGLDDGKPMFTTPIFKTPSFYCLVLPVILVVFLLLSRVKSRRE